MLSLAICDKYLTATMAVILPDNKVTYYRLTIVKIILAKDCAMTARESEGDLNRHE